ncbi:DUF6571 family protein [Streptomyces sp. SHP 1-2]|uniref:DUF6571 family protein n=1 Tax=Streptomyces sp. SHP 1-2 TaxID=2769489 RepID=UPI0022389710|nr:DUF6571 family protein [Streptomyces sp. SHP 1-2]MCW5254462.1 hypothetical protein [Streptomyces sp. SHP 1-2]
MDLDTLRDADFKLLDDAVNDWSTLVGTLEGLRKDAAGRLRGRAEKARWGGVNAKVSKEFIGKTAAEFEDAHTQATTVHKILSDTAGELKGYHRQLVTALEGGRRKGLKVVGHEGGFTVSSDTPPQERGSPGRDADAGAVALRDELERILKEATKSDDSARAVLRALADQSKLGFSGASYGDRDSAAAAIAKAEALAEVARKNPRDVTTTELAAFNATLATYRNDPLFAETFARNVGPKGALVFWAGIADPFQAAFDPARGEQAKQLQKNLGITLGQATLSDSAGMTKWKKQMIALGDQRLEIDDASNPTGFATMSNLMRFGDYDDRFLNDYGTKLLAQDKQFTGVKFNLWVGGAAQSDLNLWNHENDRGRDPMTGFLEALGHNPDAATEFFGAPDPTSDPNADDYKVNENLKYLTQQRSWASDSSFLGDSDHVAGRDSLGHALEAATTGLAYDTDIKHILATGGAQRTAETAAVMEQVSYLYGGEKGPEMLHKQPELADSLGKMAGAYIDDIDYSLSGVGDHMRNEETFPPKYPGRAYFGEAGAIDFLSVLGQNETSHGAVTAAQHLYTLSVMDANPPTSEVGIGRAHDGLMVGAEARGILDHSRVSQAEADFKADSEKANKSLGRSADWIKAGTGVLVGAGVAAIPMPGATAAAVVITPIATSTLGQVVNTFINHGIDDTVSEKSQDPTEKAQITSRKFYGAGIDQLGFAYQSYATDSLRDDHSENALKWTEDIEGAYYGIGSAENKYRGHNPHKEN